MAHKTLTEAASEILNKSRADALKMPMQNLQAVRGAQPNGDVVDLGGATHENPQGDAIGSVTAAHRPEATPPGVKPDADTDTPMKKLPTQPQSQDSGVVQPKNTFVHNDGPRGPSAGAEYMHPTKEEEEFEDDDLELTEEEIAEAIEAKRARIVESMKQKGVKEDVDAILSGETFSEDFKQKLTTIFEAAVISRAIAVVEELEAEIMEAAEESVVEIQNEIEEQVDGYLSQMVQEWKEENEVAIESGLKSEIVEDFLDGLRDLFVEHYIELPTERVDAVEAMAEEVAELKEELNKTMNQNIDLVKKINESRKQEIVTQVCEGLTATQTAKIKTLAEGVEFVTEDDYAKKVKLVRESYFSKVKQDNQGSRSVNQIALSESEGSDQTEEETSPLMEAYVNAISRTQL